MTKRLLLSVQLHPRNRASFRVPSGAVDWMVARLDRGVIRRSSRGDDMELVVELRRARELLRWRAREELSR